MNCQTLIIDIYGHMRKKSETPMTEREKERAAVVAWLRARFDTYPHGTYARCSEMQNYWEHAADCIERGDHMKGTGDE